MSSVGLDCHPRDADPRLQAGGEGRGSTPDVSLGDLHDFSESSRDPGYLTALWVQPGWPAYRIANHWASVRGGDGPARRPCVRAGNDVADEKTGNSMRWQGARGEWMGD